MLTCSGILICQNRPDGWRSRIVGYTGASLPRSGVPGSRAPIAGPFSAEHLVDGKTRLCNESRHLWECRSVHYLASFLVLETLIQLSSSTADATDTFAQQLETFAQLLRCQSPGIARHLAALSLRP
jgi:hypothetical protein